MDTNELSKIVEEKFSFLPRKYGFSKQVTRTLGREVFFDYERNFETISISFEIGSAPIIELFIPSEKTNLKPVPWAEKDGVQRERLFPKISIKQKFEPEIVKKVEEYIGEMAKQFMSSESGWLNA